MLDLANISLLLSNGNILTVSLPNAKFSKVEIISINNYCELTLSEKILPTCFDCTIINHKLYFVIGD